MPPKKAIAPKDVMSYDCAVTITLPSRFRKMKAEDQYEHTYRLLMSLLHNHKCTVIVELTSNFDVHYHAIVSLRNVEGNPLKYLKDRFRLSFGYTCIKQVEDYTGWCNYLQKDIKETAKAIYPILKDDYNIFEKQFELDLLGLPPRGP